MVLLGGFMVLVLSDAGVRLLSTDNLLLLPVDDGGVGKRAGADGADRAIAKAPRACAVVAARPADSFCAGVLAPLSFRLQSAPGRHATSPVLCSFVIVGFFILFSAGAGAAQIFKARHPGQ